MAARLTSVRLEDEMLAKLQLLAEVHSSNVAAQIREAVRRYVDAEILNPGFREDLEAAQKRQLALVDRILGSD